MAIYTTSKLTESNRMELLTNKSNKHLFDFLEDAVVEYDGIKAKKKFKKEDVKHFITGEIIPNENGEYLINDENLQGRDFACLDFDDLPIPFEEVLDKFKNKLRKYSWIAYKTISHSKNATYCRLIVELDGMANKWDYKETIKDIGYKLGLIYDPMSETYSQRMATPVKHITDIDYIVIRNVGEAYPISKGKPKPKHAEYYLHNETKYIDDDLALSMFKIYLMLERENLEHNYKHFFTCVSRLARAVLINEISYEVAVECTELLAYGNPKYLNSKLNNLYYLNYLIKRNDISRLSRYTIKETMRVAINIHKNSRRSDVKELTELLNILKVTPTTNNNKQANVNNYKVIQSNNLSLKECLAEAYQHWVNERIEYKENNVKYPKIKATDIGKILTNYIPMVKTGRSKGEADLFLYDYEEHRYTNKTDLLIIQYIQWVYDDFDPKEYQSVIRYLKGKVEFIPKDSFLDSSHLIPTANGLFNKTDKKLEDFDYRYFITTRSPIRYNPNATKPSYFDVDEFIKDIANGYEPTIQNLWELISDLLDVNNIRGKIFFLIGDGNNGKGTFIQLLKNLIGLENIASLQPQDFSSRFDTSTLVGKTCNIADDIPNTPIYDPSKLKSVATADFISVEGKGKEKYTVEMKLGILFTANELPPVNDTSNGFYRRMLVLPFEADFNGKANDRNVKDKYVKDKQVLEYIFKRALEMEFDDFTPNDKSKQAKEVYKNDNDVVRSYIVERYIPNGYADIISVPQSFIMVDIDEYWRSENLKEVPKPTPMIIKILNEIYPHRTYTISENPKRHNKKDQSHLIMYGINNHYSGTKSRQILLQTDEKIINFKAVAE